MKKIAFIGSSNTIAREGYANFIKNLFPNECDIYGMGTSSIVVVLFMLLSNNIINKYEYVMIQFNPTDSKELETFCGDRFYILSYLLYILKLFENTNSTPIFINFPYSYNDTKNISTSLLRTISSLYHIPFIDFIEYFKYIENSKIYYDTIHFNKFFIKYVAKTIIDFIEKKPHICTNIPIDFSFFTFIPTNSNLEKARRSTSLMSQDVFILNLDKQIILPSESFLCGIWYWNGSTCPNLLYRNNSITISKNLFYIYGCNFFFCRSIGYFIPSGLKGGILSVGTSQNAIEELSFSCKQMPIQSRNDAIEIVSLLCCTHPPINAGRIFYQDHREYFEKEEDILNIDIFERQNISVPNFYGTLTSLLGQNTYIFKEILQSRPDLNKYLSSLEFPAESLLIWSWQHGFNDIVELKNIKDNIADALYHLYTIPYSPSYSPQYSRLLHIIRNLRKDLQQFDPHTSLGRNALIFWFDKFGKYEFKLDSIL